MSPPPGGAAPNGKVRVRMYNVGFGDCFLLTFPYDDRPRNVLIDFGTTKQPGGVGKGYMTKIAKDIAKECGGTLDAVVVSHRHQDHLSGFAGEPGDVIKTLEPRLVVQSWTEDPQALHDARDVRHFQGLAEAQAVARRWVEGKDKAWRGSAFARSAALDVGRYGEENLSNEAAVKNLEAWGKKHDAEFLRHGSASKLEQRLSGVKVHVLGPPTLAQSAEVMGAKATDAEYWHLAAASGLAFGNGNGGNGSDADALRPFAKAAAVPEGRVPPHARWFVERMQQVSVEQMASFVRILDDYLNNTSLILLFEVNGKKLLFPGDAQIENWSYALHNGDQALLRDVDLYKVGHHGSLNGTPKTLLGGFRKKGRRKGSLQALLSTLGGKHGHPEKGTEVPREKLLAALRKGSRLACTQDQPAKMSQYVEV